MLLGILITTLTGVWFEAARDEIFRIFMPTANVKEWNLIMAHSSFDFSKEVFWGKEVIVKLVSQNLVILL